MRESATKARISIVEATRAAVPVLLDLSVALALFEKRTADEIEVTRERILKYGFGPKKRFSAIIAYCNGEAVGLAVYYFGYSGYQSAPILYVEDLFVREEFSGQGIGTKMLQWLAKLAQSEECCRMHWCVFDWNERAIEFYQAIGCTIRRDLPQVRLELEDFGTLLQRGNDAASSAQSTAGA